MKTVQIKINKPFHVYKKGQIVNVSMNNDGLPLSLYWRRRFKDAKIDNCLELIINEPKVESTIEPKQDIKQSKNTEKRAKIQKNTNN